MTRESRHTDPAFIGIGMPNSGTRWLYDQLASHRDVWMPVQKELHFFDRGMRFESARRRLHETLLVPPGDSPADRLAWSTRLSGLARACLQRSQVRFLLEYLIGPGSHRRAAIEMATQPQRDAADGIGLIENPGLGRQDFDDYRRLFAFRNRPAAGEITPAYARLHPDYVKEICSELGGTRFILIVRDPFDRAISSYRKKLRKGMGQAPAADAEFGRRLDEENLATIDPCAIADRWIAAAGVDRFMTVRFRDIMERPGRTRDAVAEFIGVPGGRRAFRRRPGFNRKQRKGAGDSLSAEELDALRRRFADSLGEIQGRYTRRFEN